MIDYIINYKAKKIEKGEIGRQAALKDLKELEKRVISKMRRNNR